MSNFDMIMIGCMVLFGIWSADARELVRIRRQIPTRAQAQAASAIAPQTQGFNLPFYSPLPGRSLGDLSPLFPFTGHGSGALEIEPGDNTYVRGNLNIPIPGWGIWDFNGGLLNAPSPFRTAVGVVARPLNPLGLKPSSLAALGQNPLFAAARNNAQALPVVELPGGFVPLRCQPPFCNPFLHNVGVGVEVEPGGDTNFGGGLDFPIPLGKNGLGTRFPLGGAIQVGNNPIIVNYGHGIGPVDPFASLTTTTQAPLLPGILGRIGKEVPFLGFPDLPPAGGVPQIRRQIPTSPFEGFPDLPPRL